MCVCVCVCVREGEREREREREQDRQIGRDRQMGSFQPVNLRVFSGIFQLLRASNISFSAMQFSFQAASPMCRLCISFRQFPAIQ